MKNNSKKSRSSSKSGNHNSSNSGKHSGGSVRLWISPELGSSLKGPLGNRGLQEPGSARYLDLADIALHPFRPKTSKPK